MSRFVEDAWVLDETEALLDMDGRRERLELVVADLQSGKIQPAGHATARDRIENGCSQDKPNTRHGRFLKLGAGSGELRMRRPGRCPGGR
jgi:hypothetical protein